MSVGLLWLEGPLQAWGHDSRFGRRATLEFPTRSGVLGLVAAAMGKDGEQKEWLAKMRPYSQTIAAYFRVKKNPWWKEGEINALIRPPVLRDFHMVGSGYDEDPKLWQGWFTPKTREGKKPVGTGARMTIRHYLQDAAFACALELPEDEKIGEALARPAWPLFLGRKSCQPSDLIWRGEFATVEDALKKGAEIAASKNRVEAFRVYEGERSDGENFTLSDVPVCFGIYKSYEDRPVSKVSAPMGL